MVDLRSRAALAVAALAVACSRAAGPAAAAPVTVDFRIEGKDATHFDGPVTSDVRPVGRTRRHRPSHVRRHQQRPGRHAGRHRWRRRWRWPRRKAVLLRRQLLPPSSSGGDDLFLDTVNGRSPTTASTRPSGRFFVNGVVRDRSACASSASSPATGSCSRRSREARRSSSSPGRRTVATGESATYTVTDGASGAPVGGAAVAGQVTGADGKATVTFDDARGADAEGDRANAVRSNGVARACTPATTATAEPTAAGCRWARRCRARRRRRCSACARGSPRARGPRLLKGHVDLGTGALAAVRLRSAPRVAGGRCCLLERARARSGVAAPLQRRRGSSTRSATGADWSYLLPSASAAAATTWTRWRSTGRATATRTPAAVPRGAGPDEAGDYSRLAALAAASAAGAGGAPRRRRSTSWSSGARRCCGRPRPCPPGPPR